ncbi:hypothetical protein KDW_04930 [Dictyobacter vulcani]|uniref:Transposase n=2 Tax=Dictyobacter vulcani TaxID=2607529 RepID=A0A5J4KJK1_9CHLR|nr:hypothetical protein KDW_04930 [Dictyobacter vulcani]
MIEEELLHLRQENALLREVVDQQRETIALQQERLRLQDAQLMKSQAIIEHLEQQLEALKRDVERLQKQLKKDSHNSHLPPSSDRFHRQPKSLRSKSGRASGVQSGHQGHTLMLIDQPDQVIVHTVDHCHHCLTPLHHAPALALERRQIIDLPTKRAVVIEHQSQAKWCPSCQSLSQAPFPSSVRAQVQYSDAFAALAVYLVQYQLLPYERSCELLHDVFGHAMSPGTLTTLIQRCAKQLEPVEILLREALCAQKVIHQDETGCHVGKHNWWVHVTCTAQLTWYVIHAKRGATALHDMNLLAHFIGVSVHDGWKSYRQFACGHALCNVHHLRELTCLAEDWNQAWAAEMKELLLQMKAHVEDAKASGQATLPARLYRCLRNQYSAIVLKGYQANMLDPPAEMSPPKRGRPKQSVALNLLDRLCQQEEAVLTFLYDFAVPFDNSQAERDVRMIKVQQKVSGCFRSIAGAQAFCRIRSYLSTMRKQGQPLLAALESTFTGELVLPAF